MHAATFCDTPTYNREVVQRIFKCISLPNSGSHLKVVSVTGIET